MHEHKGQWLIGLILKHTGIRLFALPSPLNQCTNVYCQRGGLAISQNKRVFDMNFNKIFTKMSFFFLLPLFLSGTSEHIEKKVFQKSTWHC